jgi:hypothetical protein
MEAMAVHQLANLFFPAGALMLTPFLSDQIVFGLWQSRVCI